MTKRANGTGGVPTWDGTRWVARYMDGASRRKVTVATPGKAGRDLCAAKRDAALLAVAAAGPTPKDATMTLAAWFAKWLDSLGGTVKDSTVKDYGDRARVYVLPYLGTRRLVDLTQDDVQGWMNRLRDTTGKYGNPLSGDTRVGAYNVLRMALKAGPKLPQGNPCDGVRLPSKRTRTDAWTVGEAERFLDHLDATDDRLRALWVVCLGIGLRQGEALGLRWDDLTLDSPTPWALIATALDRDTLTLTTPKGHKDGAAPKAEAVALPGFVRDALVAHKARQRAEQRDAILTGAGWTNDLDLVFTTELGRPIDPTNLAKSFVLRCKAAGVKRIRPHDTRHTCATLLRARGVPLQVIQQVLRHTDIRMTQKYAHADPATTVAAAGAMDDLFASRKAATG